MEKKKEKIRNLTKKTYKISTRITTPIYLELLKIVDSGEYLNIQEYLRDLIRENLEKRNIKLEATR